MTCIGTVIVQHHDEATRYYCLGVLEARIQIIAQVAKYIFSFACHECLLVRELYREFAGIIPDSECPGRKNMPDCRTH